MRASYLRLLLAVGMMAPAISPAAGNNPFVPSAPASAVSEQFESRLRALEERAISAEKRLSELTMENLPGLPGEMLKGAKVESVADESVEVIGMINGKCLVKRGSGTSRLEEASTKEPCESRKPAKAEPESIK